MNLSQLEILVALAETSNFSEAADRVGVTQSAVSHGLAKLEQELGVILVERSRRGITLTGAGQQVLIHAREALGSLEAIRQAASAARGVPMGSMRFGVAYPLAARLLVGILGDFQRQYPKIDLVLFEGTGQEVEEWIGESVVDVGIVRHPIPNIENRLHIESRLLVEDEVCIVFPECHRFRHLAQVDPEELVSEPLIVPRSAPWLLTEALREIGRGDIPLWFKYTVSDPRTIYLMVRDSLGVTLMPRAMIPDSMDGLLYLPLAPILPFRVGLGVRSWEMVSPVVKLFTQTAQAWATCHGFLG